MKRFWIILIIGVTVTFANTSSTANSGIKGKPQRKPGVLGVTCVASPYCPDCGNRSNVCRTVKEFFPGITALAAKRIMIDKCRRANGLDYCGGSYGCVRRKGWTPQEQQRYRSQYGGGCYKQCDNSVICYIDSRG